MWLNVSRAFHSESALFCQQQIASKSCECVTQLFQDVWETLYQTLPVILVPYHVFFQLTRCM